MKKTGKRGKDLIKLIEVCEVRDCTTQVSSENKKGFTVREFYINPAHVICMREDLKMQENHVAGALPASMDKRMQFTKISVMRGSTGIDVTVVGSPAFIQEQLNRRSELLKG